MKITTSVTRSSHQQCDPCYLHLPIFSFTYTLRVCGKIKSCCDHRFSQQIRPQKTVQLYILRDYSSGRIDSNMNNKSHSLLVVYTMLVQMRKLLLLFYSVFPNNKYQVTEAYSEFCRTYEMECFTKKVNSFLPLTILFFTRIKLVASFLAYARGNGHIKQRQLKMKEVHNKQGVDME